MLDMATDFQWEERIGRYPDETPFHEWTYQHQSGRILAVLQGPSDKRGGFTHSVTFTFAQHITMPGGPFIFIDFDSAKRFVEGIIDVKLASISLEGIIEIVEPPNQMQQAASEMMKTLTQFYPPRAVPVGPTQPDGQS